MSDPIVAYAKAAAREHARRMRLLANGASRDRLEHDIPLRCRAAEAERRRLLCPQTVIDATRTHGGER